MTTTSTDQTNRLGVHIAAAAFEALGFAFREQETSDFGIDAHVEPRAESRGTGQLLALQIKAGDSYLRERTPEGWWVRTDEEHVEYWLKHALPVILVTVDVDLTRAYWQAVTSDNVLPTGKGRKIFIPANQQVDSGSLPALLDQLTPIVPISRYTVVRQSDVSHGLAKRYSLNVVLNGTLSKAEVAAVVRGITSTGKVSQYHRNEPSLRRWDGHAADVVWVYVYPNAADLAQGNWLCRSQWVRPDLDESSRPISISGENVGDGIVVDWKPDYESAARLALEHTADKREYLDALLPLVDEFTRLLQQHGARLDLLSQGVVSFDQYRDAARKNIERVQELYRASMGLPGSPYECTEVGRQFQGLAAIMDNMVMPHTDHGLTIWPSGNGLMLAQQYRADAQKALDNVRYELSKVQ